MTKEEYIEQYGQDAFESINLIKDLPKIDKSLVDVITKQAYLELLTFPYKDIIVEIHGSKDNCHLYLYRKGGDKNNGECISYNPAVGLSSYDLFALISNLIDRALQS